MALCHFATIDIPIKIGEQELRGHLAEFVLFCLEKGYLKRGDLRRLHIVGFHVKGSHTVIKAYLEMAPDEQSPGNFTSSPGFKNDDGESPFGDQPAQFDPGVLQDAPGRSRRRKE